MGIQGLLNYWCDCLLGELEIAVKNTYAKYKLK